MKKLLFSILFVLTLTVCSAVVFADDSSTTPSSVVVTPIPPAPSTSAVTSSGINKSDPLYIDIKAKYQTLLGLRQTESQVWQSIKTQTSSNGTAEKQLIASIKSKIQSDNASDNSLTSGVKATINGLLDQRKSLISQIKAAKASKDAVTVTSLTSQLTDINNQIAANRASLKSDRDSTSSQKTSDTSIRDNLKQTTQQIKALQLQMTQTSADLHTAQASRDTEWVAFTASMKSADLAGADAHMANILTYKQQIIDKLNVILSLKAQVGSLISSFSIDGTATPADSSTTTDTTKTTVGN